MHRWRNASFLLILAIGTSIAETVQNVQKYTTLPQEEVQVSEIPVDTGKLDYESALRPAVLQKRSIANIARLLLGGGSAPPNHPLVKYPEQKTWNMASNIVAAFPGGSGLQTAASNTAEGWTRQPSSALQNIQQLFETKAKIIPYTGQVATGLTGLASVKGDLIRQIHSISTQAIAQAAAEAAARALASAAAAHAVTNSIAHSVNHGAQTGIKGGWSSYQNAYVEPSGKTPGDQPGPPYQESAHINHYQAPPSNYNPYAATTPAPPTYPPVPATYPPQPQPHMQPYQNGYYTLYNTQQPNSQTPYTPAPPVAHARPTLSPSTLIATTPSVPAGNFGRNAAQPSSTSSLLSTISSLLSASSAAYNAAFTGPNQQPSGFAGANQQRQSAYAGRGSNQQQQSATFFPTLLPSANSPLAASPPVLRPTSPATAASSILSTGINSAAAHNNGYQQQSINAISQGSGYYGGIPSGSGTSYLQHQSGSAYSSAPETRSASVNAPGYSFNQHGSGHIGANYAQPGANPYASQSVQPSPQFGSGPAGSQSAAGGIGNSRFSTNGLGYNQGPAGSRYPGNNGGAGSGPGHVGGWNNVNARPSASASTWPSSPNVYPPGYSGQATGNINNSPGSFRGSSTAQFPVAAGSSFAQQTYPTAASNAYQSPTVNNYAQAQSASYSQQPSQFNYYPNGYQSASGNPNSLGGFRNPDITQRYDSHDQRQSASTMGNDFNDDDPNDDIDNDEETRHHNYQPAQRRNRPQPNNSYSNSRYPNPAKKRPLKRPPPRTHSQSKNNHYNRNNVNTSHNSKPKHGNSVRKDVGENGKRVISTGPKKGSNFDSAVDVVDASVDEYYYEGDRYSSDSDEIRNDNNEPDTNKNRWAAKDSNGQRANSLHNQHPNGRWNGKTSVTKQASPTNVRGNGGGPERARTQPGQPKGGSSKNHGNKKIPSSNERHQEKKHKNQYLGKPKAEAAQLYRGRHRTNPQKKQQPQKSANYKSRDIYTTLPEYVFRVGERPDVFLRPGGKRKQGISVRGRGTSLYPRLGETDGSGSSSGSSTAEEILAIATSNHAIYDETIPRESPSETNLEKSSDATRAFADKNAGGSEEEEFVGASEAADEAARIDILSDQMASNTGFLTSEEFDPEEREAFVDDVYADEQSHHHPQRRQDYEEEGTESINAAVNEETEDYLDTK